MMEQKAEYPSTYLIIKGDGTFDADALDMFTKQVKLEESGESYMVVSIMGPQSSGKSTLLNKLFYTYFKEMNAREGRCQTTKGIWIARCPVNEPCTIVMDLEGTDGKEKGADDTAFEKQSALFALAVSNIVLINLWCNSIGLEHAASRPLLKIVFQAMLRLFRPRKTTLMFVLRDKTKTPLEMLESNLRKDIEEIWNSVPKPDAHKHTPLSDFFNIEVVALSSYEWMEEQFVEQVESLRQRFFHSRTPSGIAADMRGFVPASGFSFNAQQMWNVIKENKDLDLPALMVMVATVRCEEISKEKFSSFRANKELLDKEALQSHLEPSFGEKLSSLIQTCLSSYDKESHGFEDSVRSSKREQLEEKLLQLVQPAYKLIIKHIRSVTLEDFKKAFSDALNGGQAFASAALHTTQKFKRQFDEKCDVSVVKIANWDLSKTRDKFSRDLDSHITELRTTKLSELTTAYESRLREALSSPVKDLLKGGNDGAWHAIRELLNHETGTVVSEFSSELSSFHIYEEEENQMILELKNFARGFVEEKAREEASHVLLYMKERFASMMQQGKTDYQDIQVRTIIAQSSSVMLLSVMAVIRLDRDIDTVEDTLLRAFIELDNSSPEPLSSSEWEEIPLSHTLITPAECQSLWNCFIRETESTITQPIVSQVANANINNRPPESITNVIRDIAVQLASRAIANVAGFHGAIATTLLGFTAIALRGAARYAASQGWDFLANLLNLAATLVGGYEVSHLLGYEASDLLEY